MAHSYVIHDHAERHYMIFQVVGWVDIFTRLWGAFVVFGVIHNMLR